MTCLPTLDDLEAALERSRKPYAPSADETALTGILARILAEDPTVDLVDAFEAGMAMERAGQARRKPNGGDQRIVRRLGVAARWWIIQNAVRDGARSEADWLAALREAAPLVARDVLKLSRTDDRRGLFLESAVPSQIPKRTAASAHLLGELIDAHGIPFDDALARVESRADHRP